MQSLLVRAGFAGARGCGGVGFDPTFQNETWAPAGWFVIRGRGDVETPVRALFKPDPHSTDNFP
jgi:hypothetical protein